MAKTTSIITVNVPTNVKEKSTNLFNGLGLNMDIAINVFLAKAFYEKGITFEVKPKSSKEFSEALKELDYMESYLDKYKVYHDVDKMLDETLNKE